MKFILRLLCLTLVISLLLAVPVFAEEEASPWASSYFVTYSTYLWRTTGNDFEIWFDVVGRGIMTEIGTNSIILQESSDGVNWTSIKHYEPDDYPQMLCANTAGHADCVSYTGRPGYTYRAYVSFYAKKSTGFAEKYVYAYFL